MRFIKMKMGDQTNHANTAPVLESLLSIGIGHHKPCCEAPPLSQYTLSYSSFFCSLLFTYGYTLRIELMLPKPSHITVRLKENSPWIFKTKVFVGLRLTIRANKHCWYFGMWFYEVPVSIHFVFKYSNRFTSDSFIGSIIIFKPMIL